LTLWQGAQPIEFTLIWSKRSRSGHARWADLVDRSRCLCNGVQRQGNQDCRLQCADSCRC